MFWGIEQGYSTNEPRFSSGEPAHMENARGTSLEGTASTNDKRALFLVVGLLGYALEAL